MLFSRMRRGVSALAYGLIVGLVSVVALAAITQSGSMTNRLFGTVAARLTGVAPAGVAAAPQAPTGPLHARMRLNGTYSGNKDMIWLYKPASVNPQTIAEQEALCTAAGFSPARTNQTGNANIYDPTNYYCNQHCCFLGSGNNARNFITNFVNNGLPLNTGLRLWDLGCGEAYGTGGNNNAYQRSINVGDRVTVTSGNGYTFEPDVLTGGSYSAVKTVPLNFPENGLVLCQAN